MTRRLALLLLLTCVALTLLVYGRALALPLYMDDVIFARYIEPLSLPEIFYRVGIVPYYRPLSLVPWKLIQMAAGAFDAPLMHALNLIVNAVNGWLVGLLALRIAPRDGWRAWLLAFSAAIVYLLFPFSYQAVPWAAALGHLMAASGALIAMLALLAWWEHGGGWRLLLIWLGVAISVFSHENGAATVLLLCLPFALDPARLRERRKLLLALGPSLLIVAAFALIWLALPKDRDAFALTLPDVAQNAAYFAQGIGFPVAQTGGALTRATTLPSWLIAVGLSAIGLALAWLLSARGRRLFTFGGLWYAVAISVPTILLPHRYAIDGPRLMLLASVGAALVWAGALTSAVDGALGSAEPGRDPFTLRRRARLSALAALLIILAILPTSLVFINERMALHETLAPAYESMFAEATESDTSSAFINVPVWLAYRDSQYALGSEGITYMTNYIGFPDLIHINTGVWPEATALVAEDIRDEIPGAYWDVLAYETMPDAAATVRKSWRGYALQWIGGGWRWACAEQVNTRVFVLSTCHTTRQWPPDGALHETIPGPFAFEDGITLEALSAYPDDGLIAVDLAWSAREAQPVTAFVHLVCDGDETPIAQADGAPLRGLLPFASWPGGVWRELRYLNPGAAAIDGCSVHVGLYDPSTGARVPLLDGGDFAETKIAMD
ncbi:MAG: hypothetical protein IT320_04140 [Anaerolineae bacterium]|nr:hypothetical protein [Anaerolineae bacterium]